MSRAPGWIAGLAVLMLVASAPHRSARAQGTTDERRLDPATIKEAVEKDTKTFRSYWFAKKIRIGEAQKWGRSEEVKLLAEKLQTEEIRALRRIVWYVGNDRKAKDQVGKLRGLLDRSAKVGLEEWLEARKRDRFKVPKWVNDPFSPSVDEDETQTAPAGDQPRPSPKG